MACATLYVCSASVYPTSGFANPVHTLLALAIRLADHLATLPPVIEEPTGHAGAGRCLRRLRCREAVA